ncbi:MAG: hypothetical protein NZL90_03605 [Aquificaceae bacterium]|nr:hypothetical protein [Aquificaceae bacterium]MDW8237104.1 MazG nucleotide pyrophosphohydrolase domain-containing protein [Aquificaceae bacterium]
MAQDIPALKRCQILQDIASKEGFDFKHIQEVFQKISEEIEELKEALERGNLKDLEHELGDILIAIVELARFLNLDAERCLQIANDRFERRFNYVKESAKLMGKQLSQLSLEEIERLWQDSKALD